MKEQTSSEPNPGIIMEALGGYQVTLALKGAVELEIFSHIANGASTAAEIAGRCNASERGVRILCDFLTVSGFLTKSDATYRLTPESAVFLNKHSPAYIGSIALFLAHPHHMNHFQDVAALVRKGGSIDAGNLAPDDPVWVEFAKWMAPMMRMPAAALAAQVSQPGRSIKVLDIAAGHGVYGIAVAMQNPQAEIVAVDWKNVLEVAKANAVEAGLADRYRTIPGSAFDVDYGKGYDLALVTAFLHHFDPPTCVGLLKKVRASMNPGGTLAITELMPNEDRVSPPMEARFSFMMLGSTPSGDAYTWKQVEQMCTEAGFRNCTMQGLGNMPIKAVLARN
jgi:2-polyprenyl-3-methyl-5-hydroxy-6-metoxy-1,4-benzoquinol methylase